MPRIRTPWLGGPCRRASLGLVLAAAGGCSILAPQPDVSKFYVLTSPAGNAAAELTATPTLGRPMVAVGPVRFPDYLNRSQMAVRLSENEVQFSDVHRWAEPLETNFKRVLSQNLALALGRADVTIYPYVGRRPLYEVPIEVLRFETDQSGTAYLAARWSVRDGKTRAGLYTAESQLTEPAAAKGVEASVAALSAVLDRLSDEIAAALRQVGSSPP